ncbi:hypothetical protein D3C72_1277730 [compost metagenome]
MIFILRFIVVREQHICTKHTSFQLTTCGLAKYDRIPIAMHGVNIIFLGPGQLIFIEVRRSLVRRVQAILGIKNVLIFHLGFIFLQCKHVVRLLAERLAMITFW